ncbi:MAG: replication initiator [Pseudonocardia sp.]
MTTTPELISARLRSPDYRAWRAQVEATGGCAQPIRLAGSSTVLDPDGAPLIEHDGEILAPCGNRRASVCPACSDRYAADAFHLLRAGLAGDTSKDVPDSVADRPRAFLTLTAPSFGPVHTRKVTGRGFVVPCRCGQRHHPDDPRVGCALDPATYDYTGAVLWQAHAGKLWARFTTTLRRALATVLGVPAREFRDHARLSYAKVADYQRRGLVHFHAVIRLDGPDGPAAPCPAALNHATLRDAVTHAAGATALTVARPDRTALTLGWGTQIDLRPVTPSAARQIETDTGEMSDTALAGYIAKYATKATGAINGAARPIRDLDHVQYLDLTPHHRTMIETAWTLGELEQYDGLNLRRWAHMLGFRGHFLTKSQRYSTTFRAIRAEERRWRLRQDLAALDTDPNGHTIDPDSVVVINDWVPVRFGHRDDAERELATAIAERNRAQRRSKATSTRRG